MMENPVKFYKNATLEHGGVYGARSFYYGDFAQKYFSSVPQLETIQQLQAMRHLLPGKIYTYQYSPLYANRLDWYDTRPIMMSIRHFQAKNTNNKIETGINLNFLPFPVKRIILLRIFETYESMINKNIKLLNEGNINHQVPLFTAAYDIMKVLDYLWESVGRTSYRFALRSYIYPRMSNIKAIDYDDWGKILFIESKDVVGASIGKIYKEYYRKKLNNGISKVTKH